MMMFPSNMVIFQFVNGSITREPPVHLAELPRPESQSPDRKKTCSFGDGTPKKKTDVGYLGPYGSKLKNYNTSPLKSAQIIPQPLSHRVYIYILRSIGLDGLDNPARNNTPFGVSKVSSTIHQFAHQSNQS